MSGTKKPMSLDELVKDVFQEVIVLNKNISEMNKVTDRVYGTTNHDPLINGIIFKNCKYIEELFQEFMRISAKLKDVEFAVYTNEEQRKEFETKYKHPFVYDFEELMNIYDVIS